MVLAISVVLAFPKSYKTLAVPKGVIQGLGIITGSTYCGMVIPAPIVLIGVYIRIISNYKVYIIFWPRHYGIHHFLHHNPVIGQGRVGAFFGSCGSCASEGDNASGSSEPIPSCHCRFLWAASHSEIYRNLRFACVDSVEIFWKILWRLEEHQLELVVELVVSTSSTTLRAMIPISTRNMYINIKVAHEFQHGKQQLYNYRQYYIYIYTH